MTRLLPTTPKAILGVLLVLVLVVAVGAFAAGRQPGGEEDESFAVMEMGERVMAAKMSSATADDAGPAALAQARGERGAAGAAGVSVAADRAVMVERPVVVERVVEKVVAQEALAKSVAAAPASAAAAPRAVIQELATSDRQVIRNGTLALVVVDLERAVASIGDVLAGIPGAFVANSEIRPARDHQPSVMTLRIPAAAFDQALAALKALAVEVLQEQTHAQDVTEEYTDLGIRLRNLEAAERQLLVIFERAEKVEDILNIQDRLGQVRGEIERLQGRLNVLKDRIALATLHIVLHPPPDLSVQLMTQGQLSPYEARIGGEPAYRNDGRVRVLYRNDGSVRAEEVVVTLSLPEQVALVEAHENGSYDPVTRVVTWEIRDLHPGYQGEFVAVVRFESGARVLALDAAIRAATADADEGNNAATATLTFEPDLMIEVNGPTAVARGDDAELTLWYSNAGMGDAEEVSIRLSLPAGVTFVSALGGRYDAANRVIVWDVGRVRTLEESYIGASVRVDVESGRLPLAAVIAAGESERVTYNNRAEMSLTALPEDVSGRTVWSPGQTFRNSLDTLGDVARGAVDLLIWVSTFAVPLAVIASVVLVPVMLIRRRRRRAART